MDALRNSSAVNNTDKPVFDNSVITTLDQIICVSVSILGIVGNLLVLVAFLSKWGCLKTYEVFIVSLAISDLIGTLVYPSIELHLMSGGSFRLIGSAGCKTIFFLASVSVYVSSSTLVMVSVDRYIAVKWPFKQRRAICRRKIVFTWILGSVCALYTVIDIEISQISKDQWICAHANTTSFGTIISKAALTVTMQNVLPVFIMAILYTLIIYELRQSTARSFSSISKGEICRRQKHIKKTTLLLLVVVIVFFICVTPHNVFYMLYISEQHAIPEELLYPLYGVLSMLMMANSCVNPIIYGKLHQPFRKQMIRFFKSPFRINRLKQTVSTWYQSSTFYKKTKRSRNPLKKERNVDHNESEYLKDEIGITTQPPNTFVRKLVRQNAISEDNEKVQINRQTVEVEDHNMNKKEIYFYEIDDLKICMNDLDRETYL